MEKDGTQSRELLELLERYVNNTCSKEELKQFLELAKDGSDDFYEALKFQWNAKAESQQNQPRWNTLFHSMMQKANAAESLITVPSEEQAKPKVHKIEGGNRKWWAITAAAAVILVLSLTTFLYLKKENQGVAQSPQKVPVVNDVAPGGDKAILVLADGRKIVLDTASNGALAQQGGMKVIKLGGQLSYSTESAATQVLYNTITTPKGGQYQLELADGTKVWLNAASSLRFPTAFTGKERTVELTGEGYFEVAHNAQMPFHVQVNDMDVAVLGTHFNINSYSDEPAIKTTLLEGRVTVEKDKKLVFLNPGQQAILLAGQNRLQVNYDVDLEEVIAWKNGRFLFNSVDIETIMRQVARWYDVEIVFENRTNETFTGSLPRSQNVSQLLKMLEETGSVKFEINGKQIIVKSK